jgi:uncharacterized protein (DUF4415 family)
MNKKAPPAGYDENPEWTGADFARARPAGEVHPPHVVSALVKSKGGRPRGSNKEQVALRLDRDVLEKLRADGPGWQSQVNEITRKAVGL